VLCPVTLPLLPPAGNFIAGGTFTTSTPFKGTLNSKNQMTVSVEGSKCELTYTLKPVGKAAVDGAAKPAAAVKATNGAAPDAKAAPGAAPAPAPKSSAAASSVSVVLALLCAVLAFVL
jgi:hypothetical protein